MIGFGTNIITSNIKDVVDKYSNVMEKKDNIAAITIANHRRNKERASATTIGATIGVAQGVGLAGVYHLANKFPILKKCPPIKWMHSQIDNWIKDLVKSNNSRGHIVKNPVVSGVLGKITMLALTGGAFGYMADFYKTYMNTRINGKISNTQQGITGDCWVLSSLNSLSYTKEGRQAIKECIQKNKDNSITVKLKGINKEYNISKKELKEASRAYEADIDIDGKVQGYFKKYSKGDGDVLAFELAFAKYRQDLKDGNIQENLKHPSYAYDVIKNSDYPINGGTSNQVYYLLTGKKSCQISMTNATKTPAYENLNILSMYSKSKINEFIDDFSKNKEKYNATFNIKESNTIKDSKNKDFKLSSKHLYAIKSINDKNVIITDPHNSRKTKEIPIETFKRNLNSLFYTKLSEENNSSDKILQKFAEICNKNDRYMNDNM